MADYVSIIVAVVSLVASLLTAALTAGIGPFVASSAKERKAKRDSEDIFFKYSKKLFSAADNLQSRIGGIIHTDLLSFHDKSPRHHDDLYIYTCFVLGELLAWTYILKDQMELLPHVLYKPLDLFNEHLHVIRGVLLLDNGQGEGAAFRLSIGTQMAISELMTEEGGSSSVERICIGYGEFAKRWHTSECDAEDHDSLRYWFGPVVAGLQILVEKGTGAAEIHRLQRLQHILVDLMAIMDPVKSRISSRVIQRCRSAPGCPCSVCPSIVGLHQPQTRAAAEEPPTSGSKRKSESV